MIVEIERCLVEIEDDGKEQIEQDAKLAGPSTMGYNKEARPSHAIPPVPSLSSSDFSA